MQRFVRVWDLLVDVVVALAGILLWAQMIIVNIEVCARSLGHPTTWATEISSLLILWIPFMVAGWVLRNEGHVKMDLIVEHLRPSRQAMASFLTSVLGAVVMLVVAWAGLKTTINCIGDRTPTMLMLPKAPLISIIFFGSLVLAVQFVIRASRDLERWKAMKGEGKAAPEKVSPEV